MPTEKLEKLLRKGSGSSLEKIIQTAQNMDSLTGALQRALDPEIGQNILAANVRENGELVVICSSSAWASRVRFESEALLAATRDSGFDAATVRVTVSQR